MFRCVERNGHFVWGVFVHMCMCQQIEPAHRPNVLRFEYNNMSDFDTICLHYEYVCLSNEESSSITKILMHAQQFNIFILFLLAAVRV